MYINAQTSKIDMRLGRDSTLDEILEKIESIHSTEEKAESLMKNL